MPAARTVVMIASPLEEEYVARIRAVAPERVEVIYRPDLLPPTRYVADHDGVPGWTRTAAQEAEFLALLARAEVLWDLPPVAKPNALAVAPRLRWLQTTSAGVGPMVRAAGLVGTDVVVTTSSGVHAQPLTEFVFAALLHHVKELGRLREEQRAHSWVRFCSETLEGKRLAIVGPGRIGREIARVARVFRMEVQAMARDTSPERAAALGVDRIVPRSELHALLGWADAVVLATPLTAETANLIDAAAIAAMKPGAMFVNIARGAVVDEDALIAALRSGHIAFAGLDVARTEPLPPDSPLWDLPNVMIVPHSASTAFSENRKITDIFVHNLAAWLDGRPGEMTPVLDKDRGY
jgi:phosphoglycerate dehydrogenase-like enzyme